MRILSLHPAATEILFAMGAGGMVVGRSELCTYPEAALKVPSFGKEITLDMIGVFEPDLVVTGRDQDELTEAVKSQFKVFQFDPRTLEMVFKQIIGLADLTGKHVEADLVVHDLMAVLEKVEQKAKKFKKVRVYFEIAHNPPAVASCYLVELLMLAGAAPYSGEMNINKLQKFNPQMIMVSVPGEGEDFNFDLLAARDGWEDLNALKYERLFAIDDKLLYRPGPRLAEGIKKVARILHGIEVTENGAE